MKEIKEAERGRLAQDILSNPVYQESFAAIEQELYKLWQNSENQDERERLYLSTKMLERVKQSLTRAVSNGEVALKILDQKKSMAERLGLR